MECMLSNSNTVPITLPGSYLLVSIQLTTNAEKLSDYSQQVIRTRDKMLTAVECMQHQSHYNTN